MTKNPRIAAKSEGGPYDGRALVHYGTWHQVAYERDRPWRAVPGMITLANRYDQNFLAFGAYVFHPTTGLWHWFAKEADAPTDPERYALWIKEPPVTSQVAGAVSRP